MHSSATTLVATNDGTQTFAIIKTTGTTTGPFLGVPPTGKKINLDIKESALWKDGKMVEHWGVGDTISLLTQMGFFPPDALIRELAPIGDGSMVFGIMEAHGTNTGAVLGIPATGRPVAITAFEFYHFNHDGKIIDHNRVTDLLGFISDLGFVPPNATPVFSKDKVDHQFTAELDLG